MRLWCFSFRKSSHCESSQLPPPLTGPGPGPLNSHQSYYLIRHPIVAVSMSQDLHKMPVHWLPHYSEHLSEYSLWVLNGMAKYGVVCQWGVCFIEWIWGSGRLVNPTQPTRLIVRPDSQWVRLSWPIRTHMWVKFMNWTTHITHPTLWSTH